MLRAALPVVVTLGALGGLGLAGCGGRGVAPGASLVLRPACSDATRWDGAACVARPAGAREAIAANEARLEPDPAAALVAAEASAARGPHDRGAFAALWRQRAVAHALLASAAADEARDDPAGAEAQRQAQAEHEAAARAAFAMLLALDPAHRLAYTETPKATFLFEAAIAAEATRPPPAIEVDWERNLEVGASIPVDVEVVADPHRFLVRATLFVRRRGEASWRAADLALPAVGGYRRVVLPGSLTTAVRGATAVELYLRAYDDAGNEVLTWAGPEQPREVPLRWDPPPRWWRRWWVWAIGAGVVAGATGIAVYAAQWQPGDLVGGGVTVEPR